MAKNSKVHPFKTINPQDVPETESILSHKVFGLTPLKSSLYEPPKRKTLSQEPTSSKKPTELPRKPEDPRSRPQNETKNSLSDPILSSKPNVPSLRPLDIKEKQILLIPPPEDDDPNPKDSPEVPSEPSTGAPLPEELLPLEATTMIFIVKQLRPLKFQSSVQFLQSFKIFNQRGEHILSAGEVRLSRCNKFSKYDFLCFVFTTDGTPFMTIAQRNPSFHPLTKSQKKDWLLHAQADGWLNRKYKLLNGGEDVEDRSAHVHASLVTGAFLGHIWAGGDEFIIHDIEYNPSIAVIRRELREMERVLLPRQERRSSAFNESLATSCDVKYELYVETAQVGEICANVRLLEGKDTDFGSSNKPEHCGGATYPLHFEAEEKALVLAFLLYDNRTDSICRNVCEMLMSGYCISCYVFLILAIIIIVLAWRFGTGPH